MFKQKRDPAPDKPTIAPADAVQQARTRARQRLIGAVVLLAIGIIGFPLVFETQPRPIPVDVPIEIPRVVSPGEKAFVDSPAFANAPAEYKGRIARSRDRPATFRCGSTHRSAQPTRSCRDWCSSTAAAS